MLNVMTHLQWHVPFLSRFHLQKQDHSFQNSNVLICAEGFINYHSFQLLNSSVMQNQLITLFGFKFPISKLVREVLCL